MPDVTRRTLLRLFSGASSSALLIPSKAVWAGTTNLQDITGGSFALPEITVFPARAIITMDPDTPRAEAVAVVGDRIAAVGSRAEIDALVGDQPFRVVEAFADKVILPGFVEQHVHPVLAALTMTTHVISIEPWDAEEGFSAQVRDPDGYRERLLAALAAHDDANETFVTWGYHHYMHGDMSRAILDELAPDFPAIVWHRSCHEFFLNTKVMELYGVDEAWFSTLSPSAAAQGNLENGHFYEQGGMALLDLIAPAIATPERMKAGLEYSIDYYHKSGVTTACEPGGFFSKALQDAVNAVYSSDATPFNHYFIGDGKSFVLPNMDDPAAVIKMAESVYDWGTGRTRYLQKQIKLFTDGAIYSQLMQMRDGYTDGHEGAWIIDPDVFTYAFQTFWDAGWQIHIHNNGDAGMDVLLDNLETALRRNPRYDHRTVLVHFGFAAPDQIERAARLGAMVSANPYYVTALAGRYGDIGIGPERNARMVPLGEVEALGVPMSFHSDMPMAPAKPLQLASSALNRRTLEGDVVGPDQRVSVDTALKAITIDSAYTIQLEDEIGSITPGKLANFTILEEDPYEVAVEQFDKIPIWGTVLEGRLQPVETADGTTIANPAAEFCIEQGGRYEIRKDASGATQGICILKGGTEIDAWEYLRRERAKLAPTSAPGRIAQSLQEGLDQRARMRLMMSRAYSDLGLCTTDAAMRDKLCQAVSNALG
ncbi:amidohydrolase family protein [Ruegeria arenilitoris]|uniref:amidohydrolase family protein n=1 Tax=Ruegeria arenilitoris TaxID=1173585 RepID=UPI00147CF5F9|nr:amidohydrolase family protein [Ruegeria arenilitoris]